MTGFRRTILLTAVVLASGGVSAALAQEAAPATAAKDKTVKKDDVETGPPVARPPQADPDRRPRDGMERVERSAAEPRREGLSHGDRDDVRGFMQSEAKYRMRMARIRRLRKIAEQDGDKERLAKLMKLEKKLGELQTKQVNRWRERLGDEKFAQMQQRIKDRMEQRKQRRGARRDGERDRAGDRGADRDRREGRGEGRRAGDRPERDREEMRQRRDQRRERGQGTRDRRRENQGNRDDDGQRRKRRTRDDG